MPQDRKHNKKLTGAARELRKSMTPEESRLWYGFLRDYPVRFRRQMVIDHYIVDFYCHDARLVIELDGSQHYTEEALSYDRDRTKAFEARGLRVVRILNPDVKKKFVPVCEWIDHLVKQQLKE